VADEGCGGGREAASGAEEDGADRVMSPRRRAVAGFQRAVIGEERDELVDPAAIDQVRVARDGVPDPLARDELPDVHGGTIADPIRACTRRPDGARMPPCRAPSAASRTRRITYCKHCGTPLREVDLERELGMGFAERTRDRCLQLLKADPENPSAHYNLGLAYYHLGSIGNAIRAFEKAVAFDDAYPGAHFQLAVCHYRRGAMSECASAARRAIELNPRSAPARYRLAMALFHLGKLHDAGRAFTETLEADPEYVIACYQLGVIRERLDDEDGAIACFERVAASRVSRSALPGRSTARSAAGARSGGIDTTPARWRRRAKCVTRSSTSCRTGGNTSPGRAVSTRAQFAQIHVRKSPSTGTGAGSTSTSRH